jgi:hypothetical protein
MPVVSFNPIRQKGWSIENTRHISNIMASLNCLFTHENVSFLVTSITQRALVSFYIDTRQSSRSVLKL